MDFKNALKTIGRLFVRWVVGPVVTAVVGKGVLEGLHLSGRYPDLWVAQRIAGMSRASDVAASVGWAFAGLCGAAYLVVEIVRRRKGATDQSRPKASPDLLVEITGVVPAPAPMPTKVYIRLTYRGRDKISFKHPWQVEVFNAKNEVVLISHTYLQGAQLRPMERSDVFNPEIHFMTPADLFVPGLWYVIHGEDIDGNPLRAEWPDVAFRATFYSQNQ